MKIKTIMSYHYTSNRMVKIKENENTKYWYLKKKKKWWGNNGKEYSHTLLVKM